VATNRITERRIRCTTSRLGGFVVFDSVVVCSIMKKITIFTDGGARGNPGPAAIGVQILDEKGEVLDELSERIGEATNNVAEYTAVKRALEHLPDVFEDTKALQVVFKLDSQLVERQLNGAYKVKDQNLKIYVEAIKVLENECATVTYEHVRREENKEADRLVNEALDIK
jgi:ribonuclease HI